MAIEKRWERAFPVSEEGGKWIEILQKGRR